MPKLPLRARLASAIAYGAALWDAASPGARPRGLRPFAPIENGPLRAPATPGDLLLHVTALR